VGLFLDRPVNYGDLNRLPNMTIMSAETGYCTVYVTTPDEKTAKMLAEHVLQRRLAACANIMAPMQSMYWWEGALQTDTEMAVLFKTRTELVEALTVALREKHPYQTPCIVSWPIASGFAPYLDWIRQETALLE
jgi:periplasmic divalent cation tolerance protein